MKVLVVGAGIGGLAGALFLLRTGHQVTVMEKQRGPLDRVCGEGILPFGVDILNELDLGSKALDLGKPFFGITYHHGKKMVSGCFPEGRYGIGMERWRMDRMFRDACRAYSSFRLFEGQTYKVETAADYDIVLGADGIHSRLAQAHGLRSQPTPRLGVRFRVNAAPSDKVSVHFHRFGEIYLTPTHSETTSVAMLLNGGLGIKGKDLQSWCLAQFKECMPQFNQCDIKDFATRAPIAAKRGGGRPDIHLIGDAYRAFDPISGAGMSFALLCAKLATQNIDNSRAYYQSLKPAVSAISQVTNLILWLRGGGPATKLMLRQLAKSPQSFDRILHVHDGKSGLSHIGWRHLLPLLRP